MLVGCEIVSYCGEVLVVLMKSNIYLFYDILSLFLGRIIYKKGKYMFVKRCV